MLDLLSPPPFWQRYFRISSATDFDMTSSVYVKFGQLIVSTRHRTHTDAHTLMLLYTETILFFFSLSTLNTIVNMVLNCPVFSFHFCIDFELCCYIITRIHSYIETPYNRSTVRIVCPCVKWILTSSKIIDLVQCEHILFACHKHYSLFQLISLNSIGVQVIRPPQPCLPFDEVRPLNKIFKIIRIGCYHRF